MVASPAEDIQAQQAAADTTDEEVFMAAVHEFQHEQSLEDNHHQAYSAQVVNHRRRSAWSRSGKAILLAGIIAAAAMVAAAAVPTTTYGESLNNPLPPVGQEHQFAQRAWETPVLHTLYSGVTQANQHRPAQLLRQLFAPAATAATIAVITIAGLQLQS